MNKICIVKLRKKMEDAEEPAQTYGSRACEAGAVNGSPSLAHERTGMQQTHAEGARLNGSGAGRDEKVTLTLTEQQMRTLGSNPHLMSLIGGEFTGSPSSTGRDAAPLVIQFQFAATMPLQMLKTGEVIGMLRISKNYLGKMIREGNLKSYKIGKLRRFLLDDILSYLSENCDLADSPLNSTVKTINNGLSG
jgi:excisionase family DNA binding protein